MKVVAFVPIRLNSQRVEGKNLRLPVSYTHLDVYKRQVLVMAAVRSAVPGDMVVTLAVAAAAVAFCIYRLWDAYRG